MTTAAKKTYRKYRKGRVSESVKRAASILGKIGGPIGGPARARKLSSTERTRIASQAAKTRWGKKDRLRTK